MFLSWRKLGKIYEDTQVHINEVHVYRTEQVLLRNGYLSKAQMKSLFTHWHWTQILAIWFAHYHHHRQYTVIIIK